MNYMHILVRTTHYGITPELRTRIASLIYRNVTWPLSFYLKDGVELSLVARKLILSPCVQCFLVSGDCPCTVCHIMSISCYPYFLGIIQLDYYFLCLLLTAYSKIKDFWNSDLLLLSEGFFSGPLLGVLWRTASPRDVSTTFSLYSNVYRWLRAARNWGLAIVFSHKQMYEQCSATRLCLECLCCDSVIIYFQLLRLIDP